MATTELSNSKSICVLAVVICCFAILWPKIFLPMFQSALSISNTPNDSPRSDAPMLPPKVREAIKLSRAENIRTLPGRPLKGDIDINTNEIPRTGGLTGLVMPLYTIGIVVFFLYTILKMVFKNKSDKEEEELNELNEEVKDKPIVKDFKMDPEYRKFLLNDEYDRNGKRVKYNRNIRRKTNLNSEKNMQKPENVLQNFGKDKASKALHVLIRDMEEFKAKLLEVEQTKIEIREVEKKNRKHKSPDVCLNETQQKENEIFNEKQNDLKDDKEKKEKVIKDSENENQENVENDEQMKSESSIDSEYETSDENEGNDDNDDNDDNVYTNPKKEYELKEELLKNLESYYWESLLKGMNDLKHPKEE